MKTMREQIEKAIWEATDSLHDASLWFGPGDFRHPIVDELLDKIERIIAASEGCPHCGEHCDLLPARKP